MNLSEKIAASSDEVIYRDDNAQSLGDLRIPPPPPPHSYAAFYRFGIVFLLTLVIGLVIRVLFPTEYFDVREHDYAISSAEHAITFVERMLGTPNNGDLNLNSHPGLPYNLACGLARYLSVGDVGDNPVERTVYFFRHIENWWKAQTILCALIWAIGFGLLAVYGAGLPAIGVLAISLIPLIFTNDVFIGFYNLGNETFTVAFIALFLLIAKNLLRQSPRSREESSYLFALGVMAGIIYTIKLPYIIFFGAGMLVMPGALAWRTKKLSLVLRYGGIYLAGFAFLMLAVLTLFGSQVFFAFLKYHYGVLMHTGFAGVGASIGSAEKLSRVLYVIKSQIPLILTVFILAIFLSVNSRLRRTVDFPHRVIIALMTTLYFFNVFTFFKHPYGAHYAFVQPVILAFLLAELAIPIFKHYQSRLTFILSALLLLAAVSSVWSPVSSFLLQLRSLPGRRAERDRITAAINQLPVNENEAIYFLWSSHLIPFAAVFLPLRWCYIEYPTANDFRLAVLRELNFPAKYLSTEMTTQNSKNIRYVVVDEPLDQWHRHNVGYSIADIESPYARTNLDPEDTVMRTRLGLMIIEKKQPILPTEHRIVDSRLAAAIKEYSPQFTGRRAGE